MRGVFQPGPEAVRAVRRAELIVAELPETYAGKPLRCHEVARIVHRLLPESWGWVLADGKFGPYEHTWLYDRDRMVVLDCYACSRQPIVQLVDPFAVYGTWYRAEKPRTDILTVFVSEMVTRFESNPSHRPR